MSAFVVDFETINRILSVIGGSMVGWNDQNITVI